LKTIVDAFGTLEHVERLAVQIGSRMIGSTANLAAADYISGIFDQSGLSLEKQEISCPNWIEEHITLELNGEILEASANTFPHPVISPRQPFLSARPRNWNRPQSWIGY